MVNLVVLFDYKKCENAALTIKTSALNRLTKFTGLFTHSKY